MNPPMCRFCKKAEWNHRCMGVAKIAVKAISAAKKQSASRARPATSKGRKSHKTGSPPSVPDKG